MHSRGAPLCLVESRDSSMGFFAHFMQAVDNIFSCMQRGLHTTVQWPAHNCHYALPGRNGWEQYFKPVGNSVSQTSLTKEEFVLVNAFSTKPRILPFVFERFVNTRWDNLHERTVTLRDRFVMHKQLRRIVKVRPELEATVDRFYDERLRGFTVVGVHYRGNDKAEELPGGELIPLELFIDHVRHLLKSCSQPKIFLATDTQSAVHQFKQAFGSELVVSTAAQRSQSARPGPSVHTGKNTTLLGADPSKPRRHQAHPELGFQVLIDALLLARANHMVHSQSNVASAVVYLNPLITSHYLGQEAVSSCVLQP